MRILTAPGVFRPLSDTWLLARVLRTEELEHGARVVDLCTGSGALAVVAARDGAVTTAVDVSRRAVVTARLNARLNDVRIRAVRGDLFAPLAGERFDVIVSNPPYVPSPSDDLPGRGQSRGWEAGHRGRGVLDRLCHEAPERLSPGGVVLLVHSSIVGTGETLAQLRARGLEAEVAARQRGPLGPLMRVRAGMLRERGLLPAGAHEEEVVVVRGRRPGEPDRRLQPQFSSAV